MRIAITVFIVLFAILAIIYYFNASKIKGIMGNKRIKKMLNPMDGVLFSNYVSEDENKNLFTLDYVFVSFKGVFIIELKDYDGMIFGKEEDENWSQVIKFGKITNEIKNPLKENASKFFNVCKLINKKVPIFKIVCMAQDNAKNVESENVINLSMLKEFILSKDTKLTIAEVDNVAQILKNNQKQFTNKAK